MLNDVVRSLGYLTLGTRFKRISERLQGHTQRILDAHEVSIQAAQFPFLAAIDRLGPLTIGELACAVGVSQPGATRTVAELADTGFIKIALESVDQRRKIVSLTKQGKHLVEVGKRTVWPQIEAAVREICDELSGPLLVQLATLEDSLAERPLDRRVTLKGSRR